MGQVEWTWGEWAWGEWAWGEWGAGTLNFYKP